MNQRSQHTRHDRREQGFVMVTVLFLLLVLSAGGLFLLSGGTDEGDMGQAANDWVRTGYAADAGIGFTIARWDSLGIGDSLSASGDSVDLGWTSLDNGARFQALVRRTDGGTGYPTYSARITADAGAGRLGRSTKYVELTTDPWDLEIDGALKGGSERLELDNSADVSGFDIIPTGWGGFCPGTLQNKPGAVWHHESPDTIDIRGTSTVTGVPDSVIDYSLTKTNVLDFGDFDYDDLAALADIVFNGDQDIDAGIAPRATSGVCNTSNSLNWGAPENASHPCADYFPIIHIRNGALRIRTQNTAGQGILLVDDPNSWALEIEDDFRFYGIVIVRGEVRVADNTTIYGGVISGDRVRLEQNSLMRYSSCAVARAIAGAGLFSVQPIESRAVRSIM